MESLSDILEDTASFEKVATGSCSPKARCGIPTGSSISSMCAANGLFRVTLGQPHEKIRETHGGNGLTFDLQGRLINCEGDARRVTRTELDGTVGTLIDRFEGKKLNRPNDVICHSNGTLLFTDPSLRVPVEEREVQNAMIYKIAPDGTVGEVAPFEYPNGLALSPDERTLYVANTRWTQIHPCHRAGRELQHGAAADIRRHVARCDERRAGWDEGRSGGPRFLHGHDRNVGFRAGREVDRHHRNAGGLRQHRVRWRRSAHIAVYRQHVGLHAAG